MFKKKKCKKCEEKVREGFNYCPNCGSSLEEKSDKENWGMLGKKDIIKKENEFDALTKSLLGNMNNGVLGKMLGSAMKMLEKEMQKIEKDPNLKNNFELFINGKKINPGQISVKQEKPQEYSEKKASPKKFISRDKLKRFTSLPKKEPQTNMRRFSDSIVYEIDVPGVESIEDVIISRLESSIEFKALAKDKVYSKIIPINLPIKKYSLDKDKILLELETN